jgi:hypothetical protein
MKQKSLTKYKIGFVLLGLFVIILLVVVISQARATKDDTNTYNRATTISTDLNTYIVNNDLVPNSLADANISSVPSTISYQKLSSDSFKFCVDYKTTSSDFDPTAVATGIISGSATGSATGSSTNAQYQPTSSVNLYINPDHHKGNNCQTITPYVYTRVINKNSTYSPI